MKRLTGSICALLFALVSFAQLGTLKGVLSDEETGEKLVGAYVRIVGTYGAAISEPDGSFAIKNIKPGTYTVNISFIGYQQKVYNDIDIKAKGDLHIDAHHTVEDIGITLGQAFNKAIGDKLGIRRYGHSYVPLDEALSRVVLDISGRPGLKLNVEFTRARIGDFDVDLIHEFFQGFTNHANITLHIDNLRGDNAHHQSETIFKAFGRALRFAVEIDEKIKGEMPSTKGSL